MGDPNEKRGGAPWVGVRRAENRNRGGLPFQATGQSISNKARLSVWHYTGAHQDADNAAKLCGLACGPGTSPNKSPHNISHLRGIGGGGGVTRYRRSPGWSLGEHRASAVGKGTVKATVSGFGNAAFFLYPPFSELISHCE